MKPVVSVLIPPYNAEDFIGQAIESVLGQTYQGFEVIIVDDGSTERTRDRVRKFRDTRIHLIAHEQNKGICEARNTGMAAAQGHWIAPMDADDVWYKERLSKLLEVARDRKDVFVGSDLMLCFSGDRNELIPWRTLFDVRGIRARGHHRVTLADLVRYGLSVLPMFPSDIV
jgi:glycosyltransferase involved in cell wall biosynthesis